MTDNIMHVEDCRRCGFLHGFRNGCPPPALVEQVRAFVVAWEADSTYSRDPRDVGDFLFAITMADNPHWYALRHQAWEKGEGPGYEALYELVRWFYYLRWWHGRGYRSITLDGYSYWIMNDGFLVNRKPADSAGWDD
jgi:hypothetical protein